MTDKDTLDGYWGLKSDTLFFINLFDLSCGRIIPMTTFSRSFEKSHFFKEETCIFYNFFRLDITSDIVKFTDKEVITEITHAVFDPTIIIVHEIPHKEFLDSIKLKHSVNTEIAFFKISSSRGVIDFRREIYEGSTVFLPY